MHRSKANHKPNSNNTNTNRSALLWQKAPKFISPAKRFSLKRILPADKIVDDSWLHCAESFFSSINEEDIVLLATEDNVEYVKMFLLPRLDGLLNQTFLIQRSKILYAKLMASCRALSIIYCLHGIGFHNLVRFSELRIHPDILEECMQYTYLVQDNHNLLRILVPALGINLYNYKHIDTHTSTIHKSTSKSAMQMHDIYNPGEFMPWMSDMTHVLDNATEMQELLSNLRLTNDVGEELPNSNDLKSVISRGIEHILCNGFIDPASNVNVMDLFKIILVGINSLEYPNIKQNAYQILCESIYRLETENQTGGRACDAGFFNGLIYSQQSIFPDLIEIVVQNKSFASEYLLHIMNAFAKDVLTTSLTTPVDQTEFAAMVVDAADSSTCKILFSKVVDKYNQVFGYSDSEDTYLLSFDDLNVHCQFLVGCDAQDLFKVLNLEYAKILACKMQKEQLRPNF